MKARQTTYNGITMRSRLEAGYAAWLDEQGFTWEYEPQAFASERGQYLPDFVLRDVLIVFLGDRRDVYVEVKYAGWPGVPDEDAADLILELGERMSIIHDSHPSSLLLLAKPDDGHGRWLEVGVMEWDPIGVKAYWPFSYLWVTDPERSHLALARGAIPRFRGPWQGEYWNLGPKQPGS